MGADCHEWLLLGTAPEWLHEWLHEWLLMGTAAECDGVPLDL